jgi:hypothetical protein
MDKLLESLKSSREDITTPHTCDAGYVYSDMGVDIEEEQKFQDELHGIVDKMKEDLVHERKILEGTLEPEYNPAELQNELSSSTLEGKQWMTELLNGSSRTNPTPISSDESSTSFSTASNLNPGSDTLDSEGKSSEFLNPTCPVIWVDCGSVIEPSNEPSDSTVQTISVPMLGTPSEEK